MCLDDLSGCNLVVLSSTISVALSEKLTVEEMGILSAFLSSIATNLAILATKKASSDLSSTNLTGANPGIDIIL